MIKSRSAGNGCPVCAGRMICPGVNDLAYLCPEIAAQWHPVKNGKARPDQFTVGSPKKAWWQCEKGHEWQAAISSRASRKRGCPYCAGKKIVSGENDLASNFPNIARDWDEKRNSPLRPDEVASYSNKKVWWQCEKGHSYSSTVISRTGKGTACPYCSGYKVLTGFNDLSTVYPKIAAQWHPTMNGTLTPDSVTSGSAKKVWWQCAEGHVWKAVVYSRTGPDKCGCPVCAGTVNKKRAERYRAMLAEVGLEWESNSGGPD